jgi:hypothetical protein
VSICSVRLRLASDSEAHAAVARGDGRLAPGAIASRNICAIVQMCKCANVQLHKCFAVVD